MTPQDNGRFCGSCNKLVVDFTQMNDTDIIQYLLKNTHTCGILKKGQINRPMYLLSAPKRRSAWPGIAAMLVAGLFSLAPIKNHAYTNHRSGIEYFPIDGKKVEPSQNEQKVTVYIFNSETKAPISYGMVFIEGVGTFYSDQNGKVDVVINWMEDKRPENYYISISAGGYEVKNYYLKEHELKKISAANVYLNMQKMSDEDILPAGSISIQEIDTPTLK